MVCCYVRFYCYIPPLQFSEDELAYWKRLFVESLQREQESQARHRQVTRLKDEMQRQRDEQRAAAEALQQANEELRLELAKKAQELEEAQEREKERKGN